LTPAQFQSESIQWIAAVSQVVGPLAALCAAGYAAWQGALHKQQISDNTARLNGQSAKIDTLMLATPSPNYPSATATKAADGSVALSVGNAPTAPADEPQSLPTPPTPAVVATSATSTQPIAPL